MEDGFPMRIDGLVMGRFSIMEDGLVMGGSSMMGFPMRIIGLVMGG